MRQNIATAVVIGFTCGVFIALVYPHLSLDIWFFLLLGSALLVIAWRCQSGHQILLISISIFLIALAGGLWRTDLHTTTLQTNSTWVEGEELTFTGTVSREPDERETSLHVYVSAPRGDILVLTDRFAGIAYGDRVAVTGTIRKPTSFETDLGRTFNYPGYLAARGVTHTVPFAEVQLLGSGFGNPLIAELLSIKAIFLQTIEKHLPEPQAGLAEGLLLGVKRALGSELEETFRRTGIIHIVVLSGYNIMLVVAFVLYVLAFIFPWRGRLLFGLAAIVAFALMVGLSATVVRASIMAALALIARSISKTYSVVQALLVAGFIMLAINPYLLVFDPGFQLSFLATLGLILVAPHLEQSLGRVPAFIGMREFLVATLATQLFVLPLLLYQIGEFSLVSVMVNVLVLPMVPVAMLITFIMVLASFFSGMLATALSWLAYAALTYIILIPSFFANLPFAAVTVPPFPFWLVIMAYALIGYGLYYRLQESPPLAGWTIIDEHELVSEGTSTSSADNDTPVFFR